MLPLVAVAIVLILFIGGIAHIGSGSTPYWRSVDRSFADQASVIVGESNATGSQLAGLVKRLDRFDRPALEATLDGLVESAAAESSQAAALIPPSPQGGAGPAFAAVMATRSAQIGQLRAAVDGLLGMSPLPVAGAVSTSASTPPPAVSAGQAISMVSAAESALHQADTAYGALRRRLEGSIGHPRLPRSVWVAPNGPWAAGAASVVGTLSGSAALTPDPKVVLAAVRLSPSVLPTPPTGSTVPAGTALLPPTHKLSLTAVVSNVGNESERGLQVTATVQLQSNGRAANVRHAISLAAGGSVVVPFHAFSVQPGATYSVSVSIAAPAGQASGAGLSQNFVVQVARAT